MGAFEEGCVERGVWRGLCGEGYVERGMWRGLCGGCSVRQERKCYTDFNLWLLHVSRENSSIPSSQLK